MPAAHFLHLFEQNFVSVDHVAALVKQLGRGSKMAQARAAAELAALADGGPNHHDAIVGCGGTMALVRCLGSSSRAVKQGALEAVLNLSSGEDDMGTEALEAAGAVPALVQILSSSSSSSDGRNMLGDAAQELENILIDVPDCHSSFMAAGVVPAAVRLLGTPNAQLAAVSLLSALTDVEAEGAAAAVAAAGGIPALVRLLGSSEPAVEQHAVTVLGELVHACAHHSGSEHASLLHSLFG